MDGCRKLKKSDSHNTLLLSGKLKPPVLRNVLRRPRLLEMASPGETQKAISICAGAGYGKTTLMAQVAQEYPGETVWYQLDEFDEDPAVFFRYLLAAISNASKHLNESAKVRLEKHIDEDIKTDNILSLIIHELDQSSSELLFCFDDCHLLDCNSETIRSIKFLIKELPHNNKVMLASRSKVWHIQSKLRLQNIAKEIVEEDLIFSHAELRNLFEDKDLSLKSYELERLHEDTEGWIAGIILAKNYLSTGKPIPKNISTSFLRHDIYEYLAEEVLLSLPEQNQDMLMKMSLVVPIDPTICTEAFKFDDDVLGFLKRIENKHMFVSLIGDTGLYRLHPLFSKFLESMLNKKHGRSLVRKLKIDLADTYLNHGQTKKAAELLLDAEDYKKGAMVVEDVGEILLNDGEHVTLDRWLKKIVPHYSSPVLEMYQGLIYMAMRDFEAALGQLRKAKEKGRNDISVFVRCSHVIADCLYRLNRPKEGIAELVSLRQRDDLKPSEQFETEYQLSRGYWLEFDQKQFDKCCRRATELQNKNVLKGTRSKLDFLYVLKYLRQGNFIKADQVLSNILEKEKLTSTQINLYTNNMASCLMMLGRYRESLKLAKKCLARVIEVKEEIWLPIVYDTLGSVLIANGEVAEGRAYIQKIISFSSEERSAEDLGIALCHLGTLARREGNYELAFERHQESFGVSSVSRDIYAAVMSIANIGADLIRMERLDEAEEKLDEAYTRAKKYEFSYALTQIDFHRAWHSHVVGDEESEKEHLMKAFKRAKENLQNHFIIQEMAISLPLISFALRAGIEIDYLNTLLSKIKAPILNALDSLLAHPEEEIRKRALCAIESVDDVKSLPLLRRALKDENDSIRRIAKEAITSLRHKVLSPVDVLTPREAQILEMVATGASNKKIANDLFISEATVKTHTNHIFNKLGLSSRVEAALFYREIAKNSFAIGE